MSGFLGRMRDRYGDSVYLDKSDLAGEGLPRDSRPDAVWAKDRNGRPYEVFPLIGPNGEWREPGDWVFEALNRLDYSRRLPQTKSGAAMALRAHWDAEQAAERARLDESLGQGQEEMQDMAAFCSGASQNWNMNPELGHVPANLNTTHEERVRSQQRGLL